MKPDQHLYATQLSGKTVTVRKLGIEQNISHRGYGKWVVVNLETGRRLHRTARQLRRIPERP